jgi:predicted regulator of amino acid metabolism with ACT domain
MNKNLNIIAKELFGKIRTQFPKIKLGDADSMVTDEPEDARFFNFEYTQDGKMLGNVDISLSEDDGLVVIYSNDIVKEQGDASKKQFFNFLKELRELAKQNLMNFDIRDISRSNLEKRDYAYMSKNNGESSMSESKLFGTNKTSYQQLGDAKIIVKHSAPVNFENPAGRTQRIESIYIENIQGERFKYPFKHLNGARALATHVAHGGNPYDNIGQHVIGLSEELSKLRMFKNYVDRNPMVAENMNSVNMRVIERIDQVKKEIHQLQSPTRYAEFAEAFTATEAKVIPEEIMNDWIDRLTIRTFNEELKNVFPYIFKLVSENDIPVKELTIEDLVSEEEGHCSVCDNPSPKCTCDDTKEVKEFAEYESILNRIAEGADLFSQDQVQQDAAIEKLNQIIAEPLPVGTDGNNVIEALADIIDDEELTDIFKELADVDPEHDARDILKDYIELKDKENGTDILSKVNFEQTAEPTEPVEPPPEVPAEPTGGAPAEPAPAEQPVTASVDHNKDDIPFDGPYTKSSDNKDQFGNTVKHKARHLAKKGLAAAIANAKKAGMKAEDVIEMNGQQMTLASVIEAAGMQVEDFFDNKEKAESNELVEFVKSMYNMEEGSFPKGETGVLIAVEKKFGERAVPIAHRVISKLHQLGEMTRMKQLAGMR